MRIHRRVESEIPDTETKPVVVDYQSCRIPYDCWECMAIRCIMEPNLKGEETDEE